jgi:quercetin dioxygenase-like cupin family protein
MAVLGLTAALLTGCAQPGQLGSPPAPAPPAAAPASPTATAPPAGPVLLGTGRVGDAVTVRTPGPSVFSVRTVVLPPGGTTGWHRHPGTEMSIVNSGAVTLLREDDCDPVQYGAGDAVFIPDGEPHLARNDGPVPAELVVTYLLAPDAEDRSAVPPSC